MKFLSKWKTESASTGKFNSGNTPHVALFSDTSLVKYIKKIQPRPQSTYNVGDIVYVDSLGGGESLMGVVQTFGMLDMEHQLVLS